MSVQLFWVDRTDDAIIACIFAPLTQASSAQIADEIKALFNPELVKSVIIDLKKGASQLSQHFLGLIGQVKRLIRETKAALKISGAEDDVIQYLREQGLTSDVEFLSSAEVAKKKAKVRPKLDVTFINPMIATALEVFKRECRTEMKLGTPALRTHADCTVYDVAAVLSIDMEAFSGYVVIGMDLQSYRALMANTLGSAMSESTEELLTEETRLLNALYCEAKRKLAAHGHQPHSTSPAIINAYQPPEQGVAFVIPMTFAGGTAKLEIIEL